MVLTYPKPFQDVIGGEIVGSGHVSLTKQLQSRVDNLKRGNTPLSLRRQSSESEDPQSKRICLDSYGCINWRPGRLPANETRETRKHTQEELKKMYKNRSKDNKSIEKKMAATFYSQRKYIICGMESCDIARECPYLHKTPGIKTHFRELTGVDLNEEHEKAMATKCVRIVCYFKSLPHEWRSKIAKTLSDIETVEKKPEANLPGSVLLLLDFFNEEENNMFLNVDETCLPMESECAKLPSTPCIVVCGKTFSAFSLYIPKRNQ
ncbi:unnamed protein product [Oncorhynchus mykiss]|uniref:Uncharacterized protein n=1 Tax=Oncorhynchus mykiss TaxID=8022 RepID=A0A060XF14_ONCMY|nr:unnamed protein product [Oncorhynchus mykiss]